MTLHNKDAGLKGNRLMVQRKGNLPVVDSRSPAERDQEDWDVTSTVSKVRVLTAPPALGIFLLTQLWEPEEVSLSWSLCPEPNLLEDKPLPGQDNKLCKDFQWE